MECTTVINSNSITYLEFTRESQVQETLKLF